MPDQENLNQQPKKSWVDRIYSGSLLDQNSVLETILKVAALLVALSWIDTRVGSWMKQDNELEKLRNIGCVVEVSAMIALQPLEPYDNETPESYGLRQFERDMRYDQDRKTIWDACGER